MGDTDTGKGCEDGGSDSFVIDNRACIAPENDGIDITLDVPTVTISVDDWDMRFARGRIMKQPTPDYVRERVARADDEFKKRTTKKSRPYIAFAVVVAVALAVIFVVRSCG